MKGYELIKEIQDGNIDDCKIKWILGIEQGIIEVNYGKLEWKSGTFATNILTNSATEFKAIEENKEIEELNYYTVISAVEGKFEENVDKELQKITNKINELVRVVNKLIKESEEK